MICLIPLGVSSYCLSCLSLRSGSSISLAISVPAKPKWEHSRISVYLIYLPAYLEVYISESWLLILFLLVDYRPQNFPVLLGLWVGQAGDGRSSDTPWNLQASLCKLGYDQDGAKKEKGNYVSEQNTVLGTLQNLYDLHITTLFGRCGYYPQFANEKMEAPKGFIKPKVTRVITTKSLS